MQQVEPGARVAVIAAMVPELRPLVRSLGLRPARFGAVRGYEGNAGPRKVVAAVTSMGTEAARHITESLLDGCTVDHVIAVGICGAVAPSVGIGDLLVPERVVDEASGRSYEPVWLGESHPSGVLLTTDVLHNHPADLERLAAQGVVAVDMETAAIGAVCEERGVPWSVLRAISDRAGDPRVDSAVLGLAKADGSADPAAVATFLLTRPWRVPTLIRLGRGMRAAVTTSTSATLRALD